MKNQQTLDAIKLAQTLIQDNNDVTVKQILKSVDSVISIMSNGLMVDKDAAVNDLVRRNAA